MDLFDVYKLWPVEPVRALGCKVWDKNGDEYLDFYGGHAVISIGHANPVYNNCIKEQLGKISFYSNSVINSLQKELAYNLGVLCGYPSYSLFLSNSGAEANENALKLASFHTGKSKIIAFKGSFHGRTSGAVATSDNPSIISPFNSFHEVTFINPGDILSLQKELESGDYAAVIFEPIQGVAGIFELDYLFVKQLRDITERFGVVLIADEVQSGYGRTGKFFAHQHHNICPDIITVAKGMGNGFPIGGTLISPMFKPGYGLLGTTFGGNHLACAAALAVLKVMQEDALIKNASVLGESLIVSLKELQNKYGKEIISDVRGRGFMIGVEMACGYIPVRNNLLFNGKIFTGGAKSNIIRLLPPLSVSKAECDALLKSFEKEINNILTADCNE